MNALKIESSAVTVRPWSVEECTQERLRDKVCEKFQAIVKDAEDRKNNYRSNINLLGSGYWYPIDYFKALTATKQTARLNHLKKNGSFHFGLPPKGFVHVADEERPGSKRVFGYTLKEGVDPSKALKSVRESLCFIDCQEAIQLAYYETLLEIWGEEVFNRRFGMESGNPLSFDADLSRTPLASVMLPEQIFETTDEHFYCSIQMADALYFKNIPFYAYKHPNGDGAGYHCLCCQADGEKRFLTFGGPESGGNEGQMLELCAGEFNDTPIGNSELYTGDLLEKMEEKKRQVELEVPREVKIFVRTRSITAEYIRQTHERAPTEIGLHPLIRRLDVDKIRAELN